MTTDNFQSADQPTEVSSIQRKGFGLTFGQALEFLKSGEAILRRGWNGKNMYLYLNKGSVDRSDPNEQPSHHDGVSQRLFESGDAGTITRLPNINMRAASGNIVTGWLASQTDMLAEDWEILPERLSPEPAQ